jgi:hypothetical protein
MVPHSPNNYIDYILSKHLATGFKIFLKSLLVLKLMWVVILLHIHWHHGVDVKD